MGGFGLRTRDGVMFFLDTRKIRWMLERGAISMVQFEEMFLLDAKTIDDRNKSDVFVRVMAACQALWFCVDVVVRVVQGLAVTTLEITTVGTVAGSLMVYYIWKEKPADVGTIEVVDIDMSLTGLVALEEDEEARARRWFRTPLDFTNDQLWSMNLVYAYLINSLKGIMISCVPKSWRKRRAEKRQQGLGRRSDNDVLPVTGNAMVLALVATAAFMGINFIAWDFHFPTPVEQLLWRISSCVLIGQCIVGIVGEEFFDHQRGMREMQAKIWKERRSLETSPAPGEKATWQERLVWRLRGLAMKIRNNSPEQDPNLDASLLFVFLGVPFFFVYFLCRVYFLVEDCVAFRTLPPSAFETVDWWLFLPHIS